MNYWIRTIGFAMVQTAINTMVSFWIATVHARFKWEHPGGRGCEVAHLYWDYSWWYLAAIALQVIVLTIFAIKRWDRTYALTTYIGYTLLILWVGSAFIAMELPWIPYVNLLGAHY